VFADPVVRGALTSVVGPDYAVHPHRALHNNKPASDWQPMHKDSCGASPGACATIGCAG
jgi:hypothetical protein